MPKREWHQTRPRNEALACRVYAYAYAYAALLIATPNLAKLAKRMETAMNNLQTPSHERAGPAEDEAQAPNQPDKVIKEHEPAEKPPTTRHVRKHGSRSRQRRGDNWATKWWLRIRQRS